MSETPPDPLPPDLLALLGAERDAADLPSPGVEDALARVMQSVRVPLAASAAIAPPAAPVPAAGTLVKRGLLALAFGAGVSAGAIGHAVLRPAAPGPERVVERVVERRVEVPGPERVVERRVEVPVAAPAVPPAAPATPLAAPRAAAPVETSAVERGLIDQARNALVRGNPEAALRAVRDHERRFPRGGLDEERDSLRVQALAAAGQGAEARVRAAEFHRRHPGSLLGAAVDRAVAP